MPRPSWLSPDIPAATARPSNKVPAHLIDGASLPASTSPFKLIAYQAQAPSSKQPSGNEPATTTRTSQRASAVEQTDSLSEAVVEPAKAIVGEVTATGVTAQLPMMTLEDFESLACANNPTLQGLAAITQKAAGFRTQVALRANPTVGYQAVQLADKGTDQHTAFVEQEIVTGGKLELNRRVMNEAVRAQLLELETQRLRVATDVRAKFYEALAAQQTIELIADFKSVTNKGLELADLRKQALEGTQIDVLQAKVQKNEIDLAYQQAEYAYLAAWRELVAFAGASDLVPTRLVGTLPSEVQPKDWTVVAASSVESSPERRAAQARVSQARMNLERQGVQAIPNLTVQFAAGVDNGTNSGLMNLQVGAPMPVFNQNQGNIAAARAEYCRALMDVQRIDNAIRARLAEVAQAYDSASAAVSKYSREILPNAEEALELAELAYKAGETSFIQVLVARRTYFDSNLQLVLAQSQLAQANAKVDGFVLTGALDSMMDQSGDDALRGLTFSQQ